MTSTAACWASFQGSRDATYKATHLWMSSLIDCLWAVFQTLKIAVKL